MILFIQTLLIFFFYIMKHFPITLNLTITINYELYLFLCEGLKVWYWLYMFHWAGGHTGCKNITAILNCQFCRFVELYRKGCAYSLQRRLFQAFQAKDMVREEKTYTYPKLLCFHKWHKHKPKLYRPQTTYGQESPEWISLLKFVLRTIAFNNFQTLNIFR